MNILIVGGGPAGIMAAITAAKTGNTITLIEKNNKLGKKLDITGKGRCNITYKGNNEYFLSNIATNPKFMMSSINNFSNIDLMEFVNSLGVATKEERGNRIFLKSDNANELTRALEKELLKNKVNIIYNAGVKEILVEDKKVVGLKLENGKVLNADKVILATGGKSYPLTGSDGSGYLLAENVGHNIITPKPALVAIRLNEGNICEELEGLTLKNVKLKVLVDNKKTDERFGEMLFTKRGISGPIVLSSSSKINKIENVENRDIKIQIDLKPALSEEELYARINRDFEKYINKDFKNSLSDLLPSSLIPVIIQESKIQENKKVNSITREERKRLVEVLKSFTFTFKGLERIETGIVTSGGINIKEINPKTMESKMVSGLYFAGEIIDVDAYTGGFNLQIAFSTGYMAGKAAGEISG